MGQGRTLNSGLPPVTTSVKLIGQLAGVHSCFHFFTVSLKAGKDENHPMQKPKPETGHHQSVEVTIERSGVLHSPFGDGRKDDNQSENSDNSGRKNLLLD